MTLNKSLTCWCCLYTGNYGNTKLTRLSWMLNEFGCAKSLVQTLVTISENCAITIKQWKFWWFILWLNNIDCYGLIVWELWFLTPPPVWHPCDTLFLVCSTCSWCTSLSTCLPQMEQSFLPRHPYGNLEAAIHRPKGLIFQSLHDPSFLSKVPLSWHTSVILWNCAPEG